MRLADQKRPKKSDWRSTEAGVKARGPVIRKENEVPQCAGTQEAITPEREVDSCTWTERCLWTPAGQGSAPRPNQNEAQSSQLGPLEPRRKWAGQGRSCQTSATARAASS